MARIPKALKQHAGTNECGAYVLASLLHAFAKLPAGKDTKISYSGLSDTITKGMEGDKAADVIYKVTGCGPGGYNLPSAMCSVASAFGLKPTASYATGCKMLKDPTYAPEVGACAKMGFGGKEEAYGMPAPGTAQAICVAHSGGMHWLARGDDGKYMDPGYASFSDTVPKSYTFAGAWITLSL